MEKIGKLVNPPTCLLCNDYFDRKPQIADSDSDEDVPRHPESSLESGQDQNRRRPTKETKRVERGRLVFQECFEEFKTAFGVFCKLLNVNCDLGTYYEGYDDNEQPCCWECHLGLMDLYKLQKIVEETERKQRQVLEPLKLLVINNQYDSKGQMNERWVPVRAQLINELNKPELKGTQVDPVVITNDDFFFNERESEDELDMNDNNDSPLMTGLMVDGVFGRGDEVSAGDSNDAHPVFNENINVKIEVDEEEEEEDSNRNETDEDDSTMRIRGRKRKVLRKQSEEVRRKSKRKSPKDMDSNSKIHLNSAHEDSSYDPGDSSSVRETRQSRKSANSRPPAKIAKRKPVEAKVEIQKKKSHKDGELFFLLTDDILSYKGILIRFSPTEFICQEEGCFKRIQGSDSSAFQEFRRHVQDRHSDSLTDSQEKGERCCPLCPQKFNSLRKLGRHTTGQHKPPTVCTICWKPIKSYTYMNNHLWFHMNQDEKVAAEKEGFERNQKLSKENRVYRCEGCQKQFRTRYSLKGHRRNGCQGSSNSKPVGIREENDIINPETQRSGGQEKIGELSKRQLKEGELFFLLSDDLLCYRGILIRFSPTQFICQEDQCGYRLSGSDSSTFEEFRRHVKLSHSDLLTDSLNPQGETERICPLCPQKFSSLRRFRRHTFGQHKPLTVCIICWKPFKSYNVMNNHVWFHMNEEERAAAEREGFDRNQKLSKKKHSKDITSNNEEIQRSGGRQYKVDELSKRNLKEGELFVLLSDDLLCYRGILIRFSQTEFICQEDRCGHRITGSDYSAFEEFRQHAKHSHKNLLTDDCVNEEESRQRSCPLCNQRFSCLRQFRRHTFGRHKPPAVCTSCWKPLKSYNIMNNHIWFHMSAEEKATAMASGFDRNLKRKPEVKGSHKCQSCSKQFSTRPELRVHENSHLPRHLRPHFDCEECGAQMLTRTQLASHIERMHRPDLVTRKRECHICLRQFNYRDGGRYRNHMRGHTGETPFICEICGKGFTNKCNLNNHSKVHSTSRAYQCELCEMNYKSQKSLRRHQKKSHHS